MKRTFLSKEKWKSNCFSIILIILGVQCSLLLGQDNQGIRKVDCLQRYWQHPRDLVVRENLAYVATQTSGLQIVDISGALMPSMAGFYEDITAYQVALSDEHVWISDRYGAIRSFTLGVEPELIGEYVPEESGLDFGLRSHLEICGENAFYIFNLHLNNDNILRIFDISNPEEPQLISESELQGIFRIQHLNTTEGFLYIVSENFGLYIVDISNLQNPVIRGEFEAGRRSQSTAIDGDILYLTRQDELIVLDIEDPENPEQIGLLETGRQNFNSIVLHNDVAYLGGGYLYIVNIADPTSPQIIDEACFERIAIGSSEHKTMDIDENTLVLIGDIGLGSISIADPQNVADNINRRRYGVLPKVRFIYDLEKHQDYVFTLAYNYFNWHGDLDFGRLGFNLYDVADPEESDILGSLEYYDMNGPCFIEAFENNVFITGGEFVWVLDISDPQIPEPIDGAVLESMGTCIWVRDTIACVAMGMHPTVRIIDVSDPGNMEVLSRFDVEPYLTALDFRDNWLFVTSPTELRVYDITDPENPELTELYEREVIYHLYIRDNTGFLNLWNADEDSWNTEILDVSNPEEINSIASYEQHWVIQDINGDCAYTVNYLEGFRILYISDLENIEVIGNYRTPPAWFDTLIVRSAGNYAYLTNGTQLSVFDCSEAIPAAPVWVEFPVDTIYAQERDLVQFNVIAEDRNNDNLTLEMLRDGLPDSAGFNDNANGSGSFRWQTEIGDAGFYHPVFVVSDGVATDSTCVNILVNASQRVKSDQKYPANFLINRIYPNPFNSTTTISYVLPYPTHVLLQLYNPLGQRIFTMFEGHRQACVHSTNLNSSGLPSGLYFVRLEAAGQMFTGKIMLIR